MFLLSAYFENAAMNMYVQVFGPRHVFKSLGIALRSPRIYLVIELLGHQANLRLFKETMYLRYHLFYTLTLTRQHWFPQMWDGYASE